MKTIAQLLGIKKFPYTIKNDDGRVIYNETSNGFCESYEYDSNGRLTEYDNSDGKWSKWKYDSNGNETYSESSDGHWVKREYDSSGKLTYWENSLGNWARYRYNPDGKETHYSDSEGIWRNTEYDADGKEIYFENSSGYIINNRPTEHEKQLMHRLKMVKGDLDAIREFINENGLGGEFDKKTKTTDDAWTLLSNIDIACDLKSTESLKWV